MSTQPKRGALDRERKRRSREDRTPSPAPTRRAAATSCGWCGGLIEIKSTGRIPKWCSPACRQRAWEQSRAAASGRSAVEVVERLVEVRATRAPTPRREDWAPLLRELTTQLGDGRIYARDIPDLGTAIADLVAAYNRRLTRRR